MPARVDDGMDGKLQVCCCPASLVERTTKPSFCRAPTTDKSHRSRVAGSQGAAGRRVMRLSGACHRPPKRERNICRRTDVAVYQLPRFPGNICEYLSALPFAAIKRTNNNSDETTDKGHIR